MRINFQKCEFIPMNIKDSEVHEIAHVINCCIVKLPFKYLVPLHFERLKREDLQPVIDKLVKRVARWIGKLLPYSSRLVLVKTCLASVPIYLLPFIKFPKWFIRLIETQMAHCLWNNTEECHRYYLAS
jgi:hypothetical protein